MLITLLWKQIPCSMLAGAVAVLLLGVDNPKPTTPGRPAGPIIPAEAQAIIDGLNPEVAKALKESGSDRPEWVDMLSDFLDGSTMGPNSGWFQTAVTQTRFHWESTRKRLDRDSDARWPQAGRPDLRQLHLRPVPEPFRQFRQAVSAL